MKKILLAAVFVLVAGAAYAQEPDPCERPSKLPYNIWVLMSSARKAEYCQVVKDARADVDRDNQRWGLKEDPNMRLRSRGLAIGGVVTAVAGLGLALNFGQDDVNIFGSTYCVSDYGDVAYGSCGSAMQTKIGLAMIGGGVVMAIIGAKRVSVVPTFSPKSKSAAVTATIRWGGKK